mgnify:FL=1
MADSHVKPTNWNFKDLEGQTFGRWTVREYAGGADGAMWWCKCQCGNRIKVKSASLTSGRSASCGCLHKEIVAEVGRGKRGGRYAHPREYAAWNQAIQRCTNSKLNNYYRYGGRGITVCERWLHSFDNFFADMGPRPSSAHSIDRYPNRSGNYEPSNCRWATLDEQATNKDRVHTYVIDGETLTIKQIAKKYEIKVPTLRARLVRMGMTIEQAISVRLHAKKWDK